MTAITVNQPRKPRINIGRIFMWVLVALLLFITLFPFWWVVRTALTSPDMVFTNTSSLLPVEPTLINFSLYQPGGACDAPPIFATVGQVHPLITQRLQQRAIGGNLVFGIFPVGYDYVCDGHIQISLVQSPPG